jgi:NAD(P)-dependent dehydrogenase (short-subunit alcohol dehydrogenase family)
MTSNNSPPPIALVTGATRGLGRGLARGLGRTGATVYVTGRDHTALEDAARDVTEAGGNGIALPCDHTDDAQVAAAFARISEAECRLDILVNNAAAVHVAPLMAPGGFWEKDICLAEMIETGLRSSYIAAWHAARLMVPTKRGLIVNISFYGAVSYFHGPAYGAAKAGTDKMSWDMAQDLKPHNVACVSLWPGFVLTDAVRAMPKEALPPDLAASLPSWETPEFSGLVIAALFHDPTLMEHSGQALIGAERASAYGIIDIDGKQPPSYRAAMGSPTQFFTAGRAP